MNKWDRSKPFKGVLIIVEILLAAILAISVAWIRNYNEFIELDGLSQKVYKETSSFEDAVHHDGIDVLYRIRSESNLETDGVYNPDKIVDLKEYVDYGTISGEDNSGLSYRLDDLKKWAERYEEGNDSIYLDAIKGEKPIVVCQRIDNTYEYYYLEEFQRLIDNGELILDGLSEGQTKELIDSLSDTENYYFTLSDAMEFQSVLNADGVSLYQDAWLLEYSLVERYSPEGAANLCDLVNANDSWNGKFEDVYRYLETALSSLQAEWDYYSVGEVYAEENTNLSYIFYTTADNRVYSNREEYLEPISVDLEEVSKREQVEASLQKLKENGKYFIITSKLSGFDSNMRFEPNEWISRISSEFCLEGDFIYAVAVDTSYPVRDGYYNSNEAYKKIAPWSDTIITSGIAALVLFIIILIFLTQTAGRDIGGELKLSSFDFWKTELAFLLVVGIWLLPLMLTAGMGYEGQVYYEFQGMDYTRYSSIVGINMTDQVIIALIGGYTGMMFLAGYLSLVRRWKAKNLWKNSILCQVVRFIREVIRHRSCTFKVIMASGIFLVIQFILIVNSYSGASVPIMLFLLLDVVIIVWMIRQAIVRQQIKTGLTKIAAGEVEHKIPLDRMKGDQREIAETINHIGDGLNKAVEESLKSERLKTDLITNVSHDIKTPLTSIINYVDLLKRENFEEERIRSYIEILEAKAQRLKHLTEDVVEASKISSGNIQLEFMNLNLAEMITQTSGEFAEKFAQRDLKEVLKLPSEPAIVHVDGRRVWRVLENIYNNAAKYAMEGTRVYADLTLTDTMVEFTLKNVSENELNIAAEELTERFIRGDVSRGTEGSGLGLSIAQNLVEAQGGEFKLYLDGDLFKVMVRFPRVYKEVNHTEET